jgi:hypothetical protein
MGFGSLFKLKQKTMTALQILLALLGIITNPQNGGE